MEEIKEKITQIKELLQDVTTCLSPLLNNTNKADKQSQLEVVVKMAEKLNKIDTELPSEIRSLKFKLIQEIDQFKEAEQLNTELQNVLASHLNIKHKKRSKKSNNSSGTKKQLGVKVSDLIENQIISPNTKIYKTVKGQEYEAIITTNGKIKLDHNGNTTIHNSLSLAAKEIMERPINGWTWWEIKEGLTSRKLDYYRQKYLRNGK